MNVTELEVAEKAKPPMLKFSATILMTLEKTVPLYMKQMGDPEDESFVAPPTPKIGELLFPSFNNLIPQFVEQVVPNLLQLSQKEIEITVGTFYDMILFAFNTQVLSKQVPKILKADKTDTIQKLFMSTKDESSHKPYMLGSKTISRAFEKQKQDLL